MCGVMPVYGCEIFDFIPVPEMSFTLSEMEIFKNIFRFYDIAVALDVDFESATRHGHPLSPVQPIRCLCTGHNLFLYRKHSLNRMYTMCTGSRLCGRYILCARSSGVCEKQRK